MAMEIRQSLEKWFNQLKEEVFQGVQEFIQKEIKELKKYNSQL